jgi:hypothetical protein
MSTLPLEIEPLTGTLGAVVHGGHKAIQVHVKVGGDRDRTGRRRLEGARAGGVGLDEAEIVREKGTDRSRFLRGEVDKYTWRSIGSSFLPGELIAAFLCFNYPSGQIFLGDLGAYVLAFLTGMVTIMFFGRHINLSPWFAVLILIYPMTEVAFSIIRRLYRNQPIFAPDIKHLHIKIFYFLRRIPETKRLANPAVTPLLAILWMYPLIVTPWAFKKPLLITPFILIFLIVYGAIYRAVPAPKIKH